MVYIVREITLYNFGFKHSFDFGIWVSSAGRSMTGSTTTTSVDTVGDVIVAVILSRDRENGTVGVAQGRGMNGDLE